MCICVSVELRVIFVFAHKDTALLNAPNRAEQLLLSSVPFTQSLRLPISSPSHMPVSHNCGLTPSFSIFFLLLPLLFLLFSPSCPSALSL